MREWDVRTGPRGLGLRVCEWGDPDGERTLVLHGFLEQGAAWDAVAARLPGRILAPDQRGHGLSEHVGSGGFYHFWDYVSDVDGLVRHLGGPVHLVGHSMGGTVAALFASLRPESVRRLVLVEGLGPPDAGQERLARPRRFLDDQRRLPIHQPLDDVADGVARMRRIHPHMDPELARRLVTRITRPARAGDPLDPPARPGQLTWTWDPLHRQRSPQPFLADAFAHHLRAIAAPTLLVYGDRTPYAWPDLPDREALLRDARRVIVEGAGHMIHHDRPDALADAIRAHLWP